MALEYRIVDQDRDVKIVKREYIWQDETRKPATPGFDPARVVQIYGTDESVDRHNTKLRVDGWSLDDYRKNPTFLWSHNMDPAVSTMPLGSVIGIQREEFSRADGKVNKRLLFDVEFPSRGTYPFADLACDMYKQGHLRAASVGFRNLKQRRLSAEDDKEEMVKDGYDLKHPFGAADLTHNALIELSGCSVGSNPNALAKALRDSAPIEVRGLLDHDTAANGDITEEWITMRLRALRDAMSPEAEEPEIVVEDVDIDADVQEDADAFEAELERIAAERAAAPPAPVYATLEQLTALQNDLTQQFAAVVKEVKAFADELKQVRGAASGVGLAPASPVEPAPSHLDIIFAENVETLERLSSLLPR